MGGYDPTCILIQFVCFERSLHNFAIYCDRAPSPIFALCKWGKAGKGAVLALIVLEVISINRVALSNHYLTNTDILRFDQGSCLFDRIIACRLNFFYNARRHKYTIYDVYLCLQRV